MMIKRNGPNRTNESRGTYIKMFSSISGRDDVVVLTGLAKPSSMNSLSGFKPGDGADGTCSVLFIWNASKTASQLALKKNL